MSILWWNSGYNYIYDGGFMCWDKVVFDEDVGQFLIPTSGTISNLFVKTYIGCIDSTFTVRVNGVETDISVNLTSNNDAGSDTINSINVSQGDLISVILAVDIDDFTSAIVSLKFQPTV